jgi:hypothetical protein
MPSKFVCEFMIRNMYIAISKSKSIKCKLDDQALHTLGQLYRLRGLATMIFFVNFMLSSEAWYLLTGDPFYFLEFSSNPENVIEFRDAKDLWMIFREFKIDRYVYRPCHILNYLCYILAWICQVMFLMKCYF